MRNLLNGMIFSRSAKLLALVLFLLPVNVFAQMTGNRLGDATVTPGSSSKLEPYGINGGYSGESGGEFFTRHTRHGNDGGIGGSFIGTSSVTAETRASSEYLPRMQVKSPAVPAGQSAPTTFSESMMYSPALKSLDFNTPSGSRDTSLYGQTLQVDSFEFSDIWGHRKPIGSFQPLTNSLRGIDAYSK